MLKILKAVFFNTSLLLTAYLGCLVFLTPGIGIAILPLEERKALKLSRSWMDFFFLLWQQLAVGMYEIFIGVKIVITGDIEPLRDESALILMNHRTRLDWMFLNSHQLRCASLKNFVISLKKALKFIPGPGWAMQSKLYMFLERKWESDKTYLQRCIDYFKWVDVSPQILLFPEGTDLTANTKAKSDAFAEKNGLEKYDYVLHPRTTGFVFLTQSLKKAVKLNTIIDVTIAYPKNIPQNESDLVKGNFPTEIHFYIKKYKISELSLESEEDLGQWCCEIWKNKEERLKKFYEKKSFHCDSVCDQLSTNTKYFLYGVLLFWLVFIIICFYLFYVSWIFRIYILLANASFLTLGKYYGGLDDFFLYLSEKQKSQKQF